MKSYLYACFLSAMLLLVGSGSASANGHKTYQHGYHKGSGWHHGYHGKSYHGSRGWHHGYHGKGCWLRDKHRAHHTCGCSKKGRYRKGMWKKVRKIYLHKVASFQAKFYKHLNKEQIHALRTIKLQKKLAIMPLKARIKLHKTELRSALLADSPDLKTIHSHINDWAKAYEKKMTTKLDFFLKARKVLLTEEQKRHHTMLYLKKKSIYKKAKKKLAKKWKQKKLLFQHYLHHKHGKKYDPHHGCPCKKWKKKCHAGCKASCQKHASCKSKGLGYHKGYGHGHGYHKGCSHCKGHGCHKGCGCHKGYKAKKMLMKWKGYQLKRFKHSLNPEQKKLAWHLKYDKARQLLPLKAQFKLEKAKLISMMMALDVKLDTLQKQIGQVVAAKVAYKKAKISYVLRFRKNLTAEQKWQHAYLMLRKCKKKAMVQWKAKKYAKRFLLLARLKSYKLLKKWGLWTQFMGHDTAKKEAPAPKEAAPTPAPKNPAPQGR